MNKTFTRRPGRTTATSKTTPSAGCTQTGRLRVASHKAAPYGPLEDFDPVLSRYYESGGQ